MVERRQQLDAVFHALADGTRREMLRRLATGEHTISELVEAFDMSFAAASKHVRVLERAGLVRRSIRGRTHCCTLRPKPLATAQAWLNFYQRFWDARLDALEDMFR
jgi:DNA-binding transcriptional ArsR family regulator